MKKLYLFRHAKSDWSVAGLNDIDRSLNERGYTDAHRMGMHLKKSISETTLFICSPAIRAISTALIIARETSYPQGKILIYPELYDAEIDAYENLLHSCDDYFDSVFIFGHNPTISLVIEKFSGTDVGDVPTCSVTVLKFEIKKWSETIHSKGKIEEQLSPKLIAG